ncbi:MAG: hypothetical protein ACFFBP_03965 [Promethearchaeota archaeon]
MSNIYVPIDYSNVKDVIPEGEDIKYSTLAKGWYMETFGPKRKTTKWKTHILLTDKSIALQIPLELVYGYNEIKKLNPREEMCFPITNASASGKRMVVSVKGEGGVLKPKQIFLTLLHDPNYETKESFKNRSKRLINLFMSEEIGVQMTQNTNTFVEKIQNNPDYSYKDYLADGGAADKMVFNIFKKKILKGKKLPPVLPI